MALLLTVCTNLSAQTTLGGVNLGNLPNYLFFFADGSKDANWQGATKGFVGDVAVNGLVAKERTSGGVPYAGTIYTNSSSLEGWANIVSQNSPGQVTPAQAFGRTNEVSRVANLNNDLNNAFAQINALPATAGYSSVSSTSLNGLNTKNGTAQTFVINITSDLKVTSRINITGDANDVFILRWDSDGNPNNGYQGQTKFQSGGAIVPQGDLKPSNFINVAGDINASGGGSTPPLPFPQGPRLNDGTGALIAKSSNFSGGGFFTGYWLTTGDPSDGENSSLSNGIFVGGWYTTAKKFSLTSGTSGVYVAPPKTNICDNVTLGGSIGFAPYCKAALQYCPADGPIPTIISCVDPSGGANNGLEIVWLRSRTGVCSYPTRTAEEIMAGLDPNWEVIPNANGLSYMPTSVTQKTCYLRCARRPGCTTFVESNIISLSPSPDCGGPGPNCSNIIIEGNRGGNINISQLDPNAYTIVQIYDLTTWAEVFKCDGTCSTPDMNIALDPYSYYLVKVKYFQFENGFLNIVCEKNETIDFRASLEGHLGAQFNFEAIKQEDFTALMWTHNQGNLVADYALESSTDNVHFKTIDRQASEGGTSLKVYEGYDLEPSTGDNYYRLRMEMKDGSVVYSDVKLVNFPDLTRYAVFPNPANSFAKVNLEKIIGKQDVKIILFNDLGLEVKRFQLEEVYGKYYQMDIRDVKEGHYVLWIDVPGRRAVAQQLVVGRL